MLDEILHELRALRGEVGDMRTELTRYKGFVGGVAWALSVVAGLVGYVWGLMAPEKL